MDLTEKRVHGICRGVKCRELHVLEGHAVRALHKKVHIGIGVHGCRGVHCIQGHMGWGMQRSALHRGVRVVWRCTA